jgi:cell division protein FtsI/penicillin-binding protein 2
MAAVLLGGGGLVLLFSGGTQKKVPQLVGTSYSWVASAGGLSVHQPWQNSFDPVDYPELFPQKFFSAPSFSSRLETATAGGKKILVETTLDEKQQSNLLKLLHRYHPQLGAGVVLDLKTGAVLVMADYRHDDTTCENLPGVSANLCLAADFPAASLFKIVTAYGVLDKHKATRNTHYSVVGRHHTLYKYQLGLGKARYRYRPQEISFEKAFARSVNPVFGKFGIDYFSADELVSLAESFSFNHPLKFDQPVVVSRVEMPQTRFQQAETSSGFIKTTTLSPLHAALLAGAPLVADNLRQPYLVKRVVGEKGAEIYYHQPRKCEFQFKDKSACRELTAMMRATVKYGTARKSFRDVRRRRSFRKLDVGGKTGSLDMPTSGDRCEWFAGFGKDPKTGNMVAVAVVLVHGEKRTISSAYIASELIAGALINRRK